MYYIEAGAGPRRWTEQPQPEAKSQPVQTLIDRFTDDQPRGQVIGSDVDGVVRRGVDKEGVLSIDNGALRIRPLVKPRWGRSGIAYGPYPRRQGLAFATFLTNGHNTSQTGAIEALLARLKRWALGTETDRPLSRLVPLVKGRQRRYVWWRLLQWVRSGSKYLQTMPIDENLAVGWFPSESPDNPRGEGSAFLVHALGPECGEIWTRHGHSVLKSVRGLQNVQMYYVVVLRERGAAYYAASVDGVPGLDAFPRMRLLAIDPFADDPTVYAGVHQSVLGQIGFRAETRVYANQVAELAGYENWYGSAHAADALTGGGTSDATLDGSEAETGGEWTAWEGELRRTPEGVVAGADGNNTAVLDPKSPTGLIHALVKTTDKPLEGCAIVWRAKDARNFWKFVFGTHQCQLSIMENGVLSRFPATTHTYLAPNVVNSVQVSDDGKHIRLYVNGETVYGNSLTDSRLCEATGVGVRLTGGAGCGPLKAFEAHPRSLPIPPELDLGKPWTERGDHVVARDDFRGTPGDLHGRTCPVGGETWSCDIGRGHFDITGDGAVKVRATVKEPCPGRTAYTIPWAHPNFADVSVNITPPGTRRGHGELGRGGLIFWQDPRNHVIINTWMNDGYGMSISAFFRVDGYEELFDAVWTNVGRRIHWGVPYDFRVVFDGTRFLVHLNGEPVLYRALSDVYPDWHRLQINRVGIVANWEYGTDTGSTFRHFVGRNQSPVLSAQ